GAVAGAGDVTISNVRLCICYEKDMMLRKELFELAASPSGFNCLTDHITVSKRSTVATQNIVVDAQIEKARGARLKRIYHSINHVTETSNTAYAIDRFGEDNTRIHQFTTKINDITTRLFPIQ